MLGFAGWIVLSDLILGTICTKGNQLVVSRIPIFFAGLVYPCMRTNY